MVAYFPVSYSFGVYIAACRFDQHFVNNYKIYKGFSCVFFSRSIKRFTLRVLSCFYAHVPIYVHAFLLLCTYTNIAVITKLLMVVCDKKWENKNILFCHGQ